ncbi:basic salivary proline-rich protein 2-like isoform X3 [Marmota monax]|uniref:basic salivary proline-rich protein 2-like isoform X3 n=1 Tax=Marmota monax TaxID=9995 RepID=UPI0026F26BAE|nr:basic salivary proline-rich protein 2-like isoform X3 [Marmota monax]
MGVWLCGSAPRPHPQCQLGLGTPLPWTQEGPPPAQGSPGAAGLRALGCTRLPDSRGVCGPEWAPRRPCGVRTSWWETIRRETSPVLRGSQRERRGRKTARRTEARGDVTASFSPLERELEPPWSQGTDHFLPSDPREPPPSVPTPQGPLCSAEPRPVASLPSAPSQRALGGREGAGPTRESAENRDGRGREGRPGWGRTPGGNQAIQLQGDLWGAEEEGSEGAGEVLARHQEGQVTPGLSVLVPSEGRRSCPPAPLPQAEPPGRRSQTWGWGTAQDPRLPAVGPPPLTAQDPRLPAVGPPPLTAQDPRLPAVGPPPLTAQDPRLPAVGPPPLTVNQAPAPAAKTLPTSKSAKGGLGAPHFTRSSPRHLAAAAGCEHARAPRRMPTSLRPLGDRDRDRVTCAPPAPSRAGRAADPLCVRRTHGQPGGAVSTPPPNPLVLQDTRLSYPPQAPARGRALG